MNAVISLLSDSVNRILKAAVVGLGLLVFFVSVNVMAQATASHYPPNYILHQKKFYEMPNLKEAARLLREEALAKGADLNELPQYKKISKFAPTGDKSQLVKNSPFNEKIIEFDNSFVDSLTDRIGFDESSEKITAIVVISRSLTINEVIALLEEDVRILGRLRHTLFLRAEAKALLTIANNGYFLWMDENKPEYKGGFECPEAPGGIYSINHLGSVGDSYKSELELLGLTDIRYYASYNRFRVTGSLANVQRALDLWWVYYLEPRMGYQIDDE